MAQSQIRPVGVFHKFHFQVWLSALLYQRTDLISCAAHHYVHGLLRGRHRAHRESGEEYDHALPADIFESTSLGTWFR